MRIKWSGDKYLTYNSLLNRKVNIFVRLKSGNEDFLNDFKEIVEDDSPEVPSATVLWAIFQSDVVPSEQKYKTYLLGCSVRAACGVFGECGIVPDSEAEEWIDVSEKHSKPNQNMFIVHAPGDSMLPVIKDGDLCIFEFYGPELSGSRDSQIVLTQSLNNDDDYGCSYIIKKYHGKKDIGDNGNWFHTKAELQPLNTVDYSPIELLLENADDYRTIGVFKTVL